MLIKLKEFNVSAPLPKEKKKSIIKNMCRSTHLFATKEETFPPYIHPHSSEALKPNTYLLPMKKKYIKNTNLNRLFRAAVYIFKGLLSQPSTY